MADNKPLEVQEKKELVAKGEKTVPVRYYMPNTDISETEDALLVVWRCRASTARTSTSRSRRTR